ncbi:MAG: PaaI family thioesterase [Candidatus Velthaea sp.]
MRGVFAGQPVMQHLGVEISVLEPGRCTLELPYREEFGQHNGFFHAGITSTIGDTAGGLAGATLFDAGTNVLTVEFKINLVAPARGDRLIADARVERTGRTLTICRIDIDAVAAGTRVNCALMQQTLIQVV